MVKDLHSGKGDWGDLVFIKDDLVGDRVYLVDFVGIMKEKMKVRGGYWTVLGIFDEITDPYLPEEMEVKEGEIKWMKFSTGEEIVKR